MGLLRNYVLIFIAGWAIWFWMDKTGTPSAPTGRMPHAGMMAPVYPGYSTQPGRRPVQPPPGEGDLVRDFQHGVDLVKAGSYQRSFIFLWDRQSWILAGVLMLLLSVVLSGVWRRAGRWRNRRGRRPDPQ